LTVLPQKTKERNQLWQGDKWNNSEYFQAPMVHNNHKDFYVGDVVLFKNDQYESGWLWIECFWMDENCNHMVSGYLMHKDIYEDRWYLGLTTELIETRIDTLNNVISREFVKFELCNGFWQEIGEHHEIFNENEWKIKAAGAEVIIFPLGIF
jgi:hypothetical protein